MEKWLVIKVLMMCLLEQSVANSSTIRKIICETHASTISCPVDTVINIISANYGRTSRYLFPHTAISTTQCRSDVAYTSVSLNCNRSKSCRLVASNKVYGDPCRGTYKYLDVQYTCIKSATIRKIICEERASTISCPVGTVIKIQSANYGRFLRSVCPHPAIRTTQCRSGASYSKVSSRCNGIKSCRLVASNRIYGDPCRGTYKYLDVLYTCVKFSFNVYSKD